MYDLCCENNIYLSSTPVTITTEQNAFYLILVQSFIFIWLSHEKMREEGGRVVVGGREKKGRKGERERGSQEEYEQLPCRMQAQPSIHSLVRVA